MISTIGMIRNASPSPIPYSFQVSVENSKILASAGISITAVVSARATIADPHSHLLAFDIAKIDPLLDLILNEWKISHIDIVRNAIVIPSLLATICHCPVSKNSPVK